MPVDGGGAAAAPARAAKVLAVAALDFEAEPLRRRRSLSQQASDAAAVLVRQSGPGRECAAAAAEAALAEGATALVSWGVAGALLPELEPGTVLLPHVVRSANAAFAADEAWHAALVRALRDALPLTEAPLLAGDAVLETPEAKARAAAASGAAAVDLESGAIAAVAARAGVPFVAVRVIVDAAGDALPAGAERWVDAAGNRRKAAALEAAVRPREWRHLWLLAQRYRAATRTLDRLAALLVPSGFLLGAR